MCISAIMIRLIGRMSVPVLVMVVFGSVLLNVDVAQSYLIQSGAKDMDDITELGEQALQELRKGIFQGIIFCYCRTKQLEPQGMSYWVVGAPYLDSKDKREAQFNLSVTMREEFGCNEKPVIVDIRPGDDISKIPSYRMRDPAKTAKKRGLEIFMKAFDMQQQASTNKELKQVLAVYEEALRIFQGAGTEREVGLTFDGIGTVFLLMGQRKEALNYKERALVICKRLADAFCEACTLNEIGTIYRFSGQYEKALEYFRKSAEISQKNGNDDVKKTSLTGIKKIEYLLSGVTDINRIDDEGKTPLMEVSIDGNAELAKRFLEKGADVNASEKIAFTPLMLAANFGHLDVVKILVGHGAGLNAVDKTFKRTPLILAAMRGYSDVAKFLLEKGADPKIEDKSKKTALIHASEAGYPDTVKILEAASTDNKNIDPNQKNSSLATKGERRLESYNQTNPSQSAIIEKSKTDVLSKSQSLNEIDATTEKIMERWGSGYWGKLIQSILHEGGDPNTRDPKEGYTALIYVSGTKNDEALPWVNLLLNCRANVNVKSNTGNTAILNACHFDNPRVVSALIGAGANVNVRNSKLDTPLTIICKKPDVTRDTVSVVDALLNAGADVDAQNGKGQTALIKMCRWHITAEQFEIVKLLLARGADVNSSVAGNHTLLSIAASSGHLEMVKFFVNHGANIDARTSDGRTPLIQACRMNHIEIAKFLLDRGADSTIRDDQNKTAMTYIKPESAQHLQVYQSFNPRSLIKYPDINQSLMEAANGGDVEKIKQILAQGADVNFKDSDGWTPLIIASNAGHFDLVRLLLDTGARIDLKNNFGATAVIRAASQNRLEVLKYLVNKGGNVNDKDRNDRTALIEASVAGHIETMKFLINHGANVNAQSKDGTALLIVGLFSNKSTKKTEVEKLLKSYGATTD